MGTTNALALNQRLSEVLGDWIQVPTTTNVAASRLIISTNLNQYDGGRDDYFTDWWYYIVNGNNAGADRKARFYYTGNAAANVYGTVFSADTNAADIRVHRYNYTDKQRALNETIRETYPSLHKKLDITELVSQDALPNSHFRDWSVSAVPDKYALTNATATANTTAGFYWGGGKSAEVLATAADGYMYITSNNYPRLLDLMGSKISFKAWAHPEVADDAFLTIYTIKADGTTQTLNSTTTCPAGKETLLTLDDQTLNDDLVEVQFRFRIHTNAKRVRFDHARVTGYKVNEHLLPIDFREGAISQVLLQSRGASDDWCDDLNPNSWDTVWNWDIVDDGTDKHLVLPDFYSASRSIRLIGYAPMSTLTNSTDTIETDDERYLSLLLAYAKYKMYQTIEGPVSSEDTGRYASQSSKAYGEYKRLLRTCRMSPPQTNLRIKGV